MKKIATTLLIAFLVLTASFAVVNNQKIYSVTDEVFSDIETLYIASGYGLPSSSGPWSGDELLMMMSKIDRASLSNGYKKIYDSIMNELNPTADFEFDTVSLDFGFEINPEVYFRTNAAATTAEYQKAFTEDSEKIMAAIATDSYEGLNKWTQKFLQSKSFNLEKIMSGQETIEKQMEDFVGADFDILDNRYNGSSEWFHGEDSRSSFLTATFETWAADNFYGYFELSLRDAAWKNIYQRKLAYNLYGLTGYSVKDTDDTKVPFMGLISWQFPQKAFASVGGNHWTLTVGRDKLSWGAGETGNLMLSKRFDNHTFAQFTTFHNNFNYTLLATYYPYYGDVYQGDYTCGQDSDLQDGFKSLIAHRLEYSMFKNKVNFAITESVMVRKLANEPFSLAMVNPFGLMHNEYTRTNTNSLLVFEADYTPIKHLNIYGQFALDDFSLPGESDNVVPDANGFMLGVKGNIDLNNAVLSFNVEATKTSPYLYLRGIYSQKSNYKYQNKYSYGLGYDAVTRFFKNSTGIVYNNDFVTYTYGNDVFVLHAGVEYKIPETLVASAKYYGIFHGVMNINSPWGEAGDVNNKVKTPSTTDPYWNGAYDTPKTGVVEKSHIISLAAEYQTPVKGLSVNAVTDFVFTNNWNNNNGAKFNDIQATLGVKYVL